MKKFALIPLLLIPVGLQASHVRKLALVGTSAAAAAPFLYRAYDWHDKKQHLDDWVSKLDDVDPVVAQVARTHLQQQGHAGANEIPMKVYDGDHSMEASCDGVIGFSYHRAEKVKNALISPHEDGATSTLSIFKHDLDHEMFHIEDQHAKKSIAADIWIPGLIEAAALPISYKLLKTKNLKLFTLGLLASVPIKFGATWILNLLHRRDQEWRAEMAAIQKSSSVDDLRNVGAFRQQILEKGVMVRLAEYFAGDTSQSSALPILMKMFGQKIEFDLERARSDKKYSAEQQLKIVEIYKKFYTQPYHWPLRVMNLEQDLDHPFILDIVEQFHKRIEEVQDLK